MKKYRVSSIITLFFFLLMSPFSSQAQSPYKFWLSKENKRHKLAGKIWSTAEKKFISNKDLVSRLAYRDYILLGEIHDNADHHRLHAWLIGKIVRYDRRPVIVMEMINREQEPALKSYMAKARARKQPNPALNLGPALNWNKIWGYDWKIYRPIASIIFANRLLLKPGSPAKEDVAKLKKDGLSSEELKKLALNKKFSLSVQNSLKDELGRSHCGALPYSALDSMANVQRYRDAILADNLIKAAWPRGAILIAGNGHIRNDRGVPFYVKSRKPNANIVTLALREVEDGDNSPEEYIAPSASDKPIFDYIWFTATHKREDPCKVFAKRKQAEKKKEN